MDGKKVNQGLKEQDMGMRTAWPYTPKTFLDTFASGKQVANFGCRKSSAQFCLMLCFIPQCAILLV